MRLILSFRSGFRLTGRAQAASYNSAMARGWESKSVAAQQEEAASSSKEKSKARSPEQIARDKQRQGLLLSRSRVQQQLAAAQNSVHRGMLEKALAELDARLAELA